jgi:hypothetical protein
VQVVEVDVVDIQPPEAGLDLHAGIGRRAIDPAVLGVARQAQAELAGQHHPIAAVGDGAGDQLLVVPGAVDVGGVDEVDPQVDRPVQGADRLLVVGPAVAVGKAHGAIALTADGELPDGWHVGLLDVREARG